MFSLFSQMLEGIVGAFEAGSPLQFFSLHYSEIKSIQTE